MMFERNFNSRHNGKPNSAVVTEGGVMNPSVLSPLFGRLQTLQQRIGQAVAAEQWGWLEELDIQLRHCLRELEPYKPQLDQQQQTMLAQFALQYQQQWERVCQRTMELEQQLAGLRQQREGNLAYDWVNQLDETS